MNLNYLGKTFIKIKASNTVKSFIEEEFKIEESEFLKVIVSKLDGIEAPTAEISPKLLTSSPP